KEEGLCELTIALGHASGHVEQEEYDRVHRGLSSLRELTKAQIIVGEARQRAVHAAPLDELLERAPPIEPRTGAAPVPALAGPIGLLGGADAGPEVRQL